MRALKSRRTLGNARLPAAQHSRRHGQHTFASPLACPTAASASVNGSSTRPSSPSRRSATTVRSASRCCLAGIFRCAHLFDGDGRRGPGGALCGSRARDETADVRYIVSNPRARRRARHRVEGGVVPVADPWFTSAVKPADRARLLHRPALPDGTLTGVRRSRALRLTSNPTRAPPAAHRDGRIYEGPLQARGRRALGASRPTRPRDALDLEACWTHACLFLAGGGRRVRAVGSQPRRLGPAPRPRSSVTRAISTVRDVPKRARDVPGPEPRRPSRRISVEADSERDDDGCVATTTGAR